MKTWTSYIPAFHLKISGHDTAQFEKGAFDKSTKVGKLIAEYSNVRGTIT